jgi:sulfofructose kinase
MARVVGIGHCNLDYLGVVERYPPIDRKEQLCEFSIQGGGPVATALVALSTFGVSTQFVGKVADDDLGRFIVRDLCDAGVGVEYLSVEAGKTSPFSFIAVDRHSGLRNIFWTPGTVSRLELGEVPLDFLTGAEVLLCDGHQPVLQIRAAEKARELGITVVTDAGGVREGMGDLLSLTDVLIASERFAAEVAPRPDLAEVLDELHALGPRVVVVTLGAEGSVGSDGGRLVREAAWPVKVVDTTGAGDVFHGAYIYALLQHWDLARSMRFASVAAGLKCRALGGRAGIPRLEEVLRLL